MLRSSFAVKMLLTYLLGTLAIAFLADWLLSAQLTQNFALAGLSPEQSAKALLEFRKIFWFCALAWLGLSLIFSRVYLKRLETILARWRRMQKKFDKSENLSAKGMLEKKDELERMDQWIGKLSADHEKKVSELIEERNQLKTTLDTLKEGVMVLSHDGKIVLLNPALQNLLEFDESVLGKPPIEVLRNAALQEIVERCLAGEKIQSQEIQLIRNGREKTLLIQATSLREISPQLGAIVAIDDISALRQLENIRRDFVANLSHELKTPLTSIQGYVETLIDGDLQDKESTQNFLQIIDNNAKRMSRLIESLLRLSEIENQRWVLKPETIVVAGFLREIADLFEIQLKKKNMKIEIGCDSQLTLTSDKLALTQIMSNLVDNAIKYGKAETTIKLRCFEKNSSVLFEVEDQGVGIAKHQLERIFERFYRVDAARSRLADSSGLGLSIVKHLVQLLGGKIEVKSEIEKGSVFYFEIPIIQAATGKP